MSSKKDLKETRSFYIFLLVHDFRQVPKRIAIAVWVGISTSALMIYQTQVIGSAFFTELIKEGFSFIIWTVWLKLKYRSVLPLRTW